MDLELQGRVATITGGGRGIGKAVALALADHGASVGICGRTAETLNATAEEIRAKGVEAWPIVVDVRVLENIQAFISQVAASAGRLDIHINNAVSSVRAPMNEQTDELWRNHLDVKLMAYIRSAREVLPHMQKNGWGRIVNIGGITARISASHRVTNGVINAGVANFTKSFADFIARDKITVNCVHPGTTVTDRMMEGFERYARDAGVSVEEMERQKAQEIPMGEFTQPEDIANAVLFFCSPMARMVTGQAIAVDGGISDAINY